MHTSRMSRVAYATTAVLCSTAATAPSPAPQASVPAGAAAHSGSRGRGGDGASTRATGWRARRGGSAHRG
eukprot:9434112-Pyramimonas_sp.AAC.2